MLTLEKCECYCFAALIIEGLYSFFLFRVDRHVDYVVDQVVGKLIEIS